MFVCFVSVLFVDLVYLAFFVNIDFDIYTRLEDIASFIQPRPKTEEKKTLAQ